ncbi:MAG: DUF308 domain-containing protein [Oscillospiraceae bacterium]|nr:DUF308 domain-containing protein [Oscillospiraceae bacterium]
MGKKKEMKKRQEAKERAENKEQRSGIGKAVWSALLLIGMGLLLLLRPDFGPNTVAMIVGWVLIGAGAIGVLVSVLSWPVMGVMEILLGLAAAGFGIYILLNPDALIDIIGIALGIYLVLQSLTTIIESIKLKKFGYNFIPNLVSALVMLVLGVLLLVFRQSIAGWLMRLVGGFMVACGAANLLLRTSAVKNLRKPKDVVDADE